ncbi:mannitol-1-phosphate 5-dehydrogenase [Paenibacillus alginolyticus]|uniref:Mannitol-1-phosphate 5-dehydrogenase n=1 Tax=Paenibacillus alginolyticus TaxID=59839 RepID=A0ABT4GKS3_9BACL|nr:mannitol-1-phosphate 5-dehydrogenase [Paenibacillus alginolyticus]MCY9696639.1 mannitol-1-phosphate 5-dehydrogenase [Paenibacillus alginolyticus]MEC0144907.1 mannitol-1-phosphate 5-dehydrogenase [Paenibacillus alginolyticus]
MRAVHFGAGNIGRGFIGLILSQAGYEVIFSDVNDSLVELLQERKSYTVRLANEEQDTFTVSNVKAINGKNLEDVARAVAEADLVTTAVGVNILKHIAAGIAKGIEMRIERGAAPLHIIACENAIGGSTQLKEHVYAHLSEDLRDKVDASIAFPDAAVDRIVPIQHNEDPLQVTVEPFYEWVVDESQMMEGFHRIDGIHYVKHLEPYIERKLFTVNTGHCSAAYLGYLHGFTTIQDAMANSQIASLVRHVMHETGALLIKKHGFDLAQHEQYIDKILNRFINHHLIDEVTRVGRSPIRKLSSNDRLVRPALQAYELGMKPTYLAMAMAAAFLFKDQEDPEAVKIQADLQKLGVAQTITKYTTIGEDHLIHEMIKTQYDQLQHSDLT